VRTWVRALVVVACALIFNSVETFTQTSPMLDWDEDPTAIVTGFAVTVDGVRTDYGLTPRQSDGTCNCSVPLPFSSGRHTVSVIAYNASGESSSAPFIVGPTSSPGGPYSGLAGTALNVTGAGSTDTVGTITTYTWSWGDGTANSSATSATASHTYAAAGSFTITLTVADDFAASHSATTTATITAPAQPPGMPSAPNPANGATGVAQNPTLTWAASGATSYDVQFGTTNPPPQVVAGQTSASYVPAAPTGGTTYFWRIVARSAGGTTTGPVWSFTTIAKPGTPTSPVPSNGATGVSTSPTLTWSASGATSYDVLFGTTNPPTPVSSNQTATSFSPGSALGASTSYYWQVVARNSAGTTSGPIWSFTTAASQTSPTTDIVIYASDILASNVHGAWTTAADSTSPNGVKLVSPNAGRSAISTPLVTPTDYIDVPFDATPGTPYTLWIRLRAQGDSKGNDSLWVQFSDAQVGGVHMYPLDSTSALLVNLATSNSGKSISGWGWQNGAYWLTQAATITFAGAGTHMLRIQVREDGIQFDQIVLSPSTYLTTPPGPVANDATIVKK
jgi:PKD repeat protein